MLGRRELKLALALYVAFTLSVIVPSHTRWHGGHGDEGRADAVATEHRIHSEHDPLQAPESGDDHTDHCSICLFASGLTVGPALATALATLDVVTIRPESAPTPVLCSSFVPTLHGRAPPVSI